MKFAAEMEGDLRCRQLSEKWLDKWLQTLVLVGSFVQKRETLSTHTKHCSNQKWTERADQLYTMLALVSSSAEFLSTLRIEVGNSCYTLELTPIFNSRISKPFGSTVSSRDFSLGQSTTQELCAVFCPELSPTGLPQALGPFHRQNTGRLPGKCQCPLYQPG